MIELLGDMVSIGVQPESYWNLTLREITSCINSYNKRVKERAGMKARMDYTLSGLISCALSSKGLPNIFEVYGDILGNNEEVDKSTENRSVERMKMYMYNFALEHNAKRKRGAEHDT